VAVGVGVASGVGVDEPLPDEPMESMDDVPF